MRLLEALIHAVEIETSSGPNEVCYRESPEFYDPIFAIGYGTFVSILRGDHIPTDPWSALEQLGPRVAPALDRLIELLDDDAFSTRNNRRLTRAIAAIGDPAVPRLIELLMTDGYRLSALEALDLIGPPALAAVESVLGVMLLRDDRLHDRAARTLSTLLQGETTAPPQLTDLLDAKDGAIRIAAAIALSGNKSFSRQAQSILADTLATDGSGIQSTVVLGALIHFSQIDSAPLVDVLSKMFESDTCFRYSIITILTAAAPDAPQTHTVVNFALASGDPTLVGVALGQIAKTGMSRAHDLGTVRDWILQNHPEQSSVMLRRIEEIEFERQRNE